MKTINLKIWQVILIWIFIIFSIIGCGSRKVEKSKEVTKENKTTELTTTDNSTIEIKADTNTKVIDCTNTDEIEIAPIDNSKEMVVNGKTYKNAILKHKKIKANIITDKAEKVATNQKNDVKTDLKEVVAIEKIKEIKNVERKQFDWTKIIVVGSIMLLLITMFILYYYFGIGRKKKNDDSVS